MFHTRMTLHRRAYQHKTAKIIEYMYVHIFVCLNALHRLIGVVSFGYTLKTVLYIIFISIQYTICYWLFETNMNDSLNLTYRITEALLKADEHYHMQGTKG